MQRSAWARYVVAGLVLSVCGGAWGQNLVGDLLGGKLIKPKVGQWVWYNVTDAKGENRFALRQAVVGEEKVGRKEGYWVEFELVPELGYKTLYKVLLTGPASDPDNIHRVLFRQGPEPMEELPVKHEGEAVEEKPNRPTRKSLGMESVRVVEGEIRAEHIQATSEGRVVDLWIDESVRPTGVVRLRTSDGEMVLRSHGEGGKYGESLIDAPVGLEVNAMTAPDEPTTSEDEPKPEPVEGE